MCLENKSVFDKNWACFVFSICFEPGGGQLIQFENQTELDLINDILAYSTTSLPIKDSGFMTGIWKDPYHLFSTSAPGDKM
jgi:hypothetical protein